MFTSNIAVSKLSDEDIPLCFVLISNSFAHDAPFVDNYFPGHDTPEGRILGTKRLLAWKNGSEAEGAAWIKATKEVDGVQRIIGLAAWSHMKEAPPDDLEKVEGDLSVAWPDEGNREYMKQLWFWYVKPRSKHVVESQGKGVYVLELLAIHPDHQGIGAGTALVQWGTKYADDHSLQSVVESTPKAVRCYEKCGFKIEIPEMDFGEDQAGRKKPVLPFLVREAETSLH